jgi:hypothetical protein
MRKHVTWSLNKRGLSPIFATIILATIIIVFGSVAYYYSSNLTTSTTNNYSNSISTSQQSISERLAFENVLYNSSSRILTVYIINCGSSNDVKINSVFLYDTNHTIIHVYSVSDVPNLITKLKTIDGGTLISGNSLNVGKEGVFTVTGVSLTPGSIYNIELITKNGSAFDYELTP